MNRLDPISEARTNRNTSAVMGAQAKLLQTIDGAFDRFGETGNIENLRRELHVNVEEALSGVSDTQANDVVRLYSEKIRNVLSSPKRNINSPPLKYSEDDIARIAQLIVSHRRYIHGSIAEVRKSVYLPERRKIAVLGALFESTGLPQIADRLSDRTGYSSGTMVGTIGSLKSWCEETGWEIKGNSKTGWTIENKKYE